MYNKLNLIILTKSGNIVLRNAIVYSYEKSVFTNGCSFINIPTGAFEDTAKIVQEYILKTFSIPCGNVKIIETRKQIMDPDKPFHAICRINSELEPLLINENYRNYFKNCDPNNLPLMETYEKNKLEQFIHDGTFDDVLLPEESNEISL